MKDANQVLTTDRSDFESSPRTLPKVNLKKQVSLDMRIFVFTLNVMSISRWIPEAFFNNKTYVKEDKKENEDQTIA